MEKPTSAITMNEQAPLPAFRIAQLHDTQDRSPTNATFTPPTGAKNAAVISIRRRSYDRLMADKPEAALRYFDDDDGEDVTVGILRNERDHSD